VNGDIVVTAASNIYDAKKVEARKDWRKDLGLDAAKACLVSTAETKVLEDTETYLRNMEETVTKFLGRRLSWGCGPTELSKMLIEPSKTYAIMPRKMSDYAYE
jgi:hypothetical protein